MKESIEEKSQPASHFSSPPLLGDVSRVALQQPTQPSFRQLFYPRVLPQHDGIILPSDYSTAGTNSRVEKYVE